MLMTAIAPAAKPARPRKTLSLASSTPAPAARRIMPSVPAPFALRLLDRAEENVRHVRPDEDVSGLADDIAAHGLLQPLIGYRDPDSPAIRIVGGGRRLQALLQLQGDGLIDGGFEVPVLIRDQEEAVELSLAENLQQRTMSPVDEFFAFKALIDTGHYSPAGLAARFGFSERVVKQRLRLAELAEPIIDALAAREITLDAAMAYAGTQDRELQREIFTAEKRRAYDPHRLANIRHSVAAKGMKVDHPVLRYLGTDAYEAAGGEYEDGLFTDVPDADRIVARPMLVLAEAAAKIDRDMPGLLATACEVEDLAPTITGYVTAAGLRLHSWGNPETKAPAGRVRVDRSDQTALWRAVRTHGVDVQILVGIDGAGELVLHPRTVFVAKADRKLVDGSNATSADVDQATLAADRAAAERGRGVATWAARLGVGSFAGTPFEGRATWPDPFEDRTHACRRDGIPGQRVHVYVFVPDALIATLQKPAERRYDKWLAERAARAGAAAPDADLVAHAAALLAMDPPAVAIIADEVWVRRDDGSYANADEPDVIVETWPFLLDCHRTDQIGATFASIEAFDAASIAQGDAA